MISNRDFVSVDVFEDEWGDPGLEFEVSGRAARRLGNFTEEHLDKRMPIVMDGRVLMAPVVNSRIDTEAYVAFGNQDADAEQLTIMLESGPLPCRLIPLE